MSIGIDSSLAGHPICNRVFERSCLPELKPTDRPTDARSNGGLQLPMVVFPAYTHFSMRHTYAGRKEDSSFLSFPTRHVCSLFLSSTSFLLAFLTSFVLSYYTRVLLFPFVPPLSLSLSLSRIAVDDS